MKQILFFLLISLNGFSQVVDTIYFDKNWEYTNSDQYYYYRVSEILDSTIKFSDYYRNGVIQNTGLIELDTSLLKSGYLSKFIGPISYFDKKGRLLRNEIHRPDLYLNLIKKYYDDSLNIEEEKFSKSVLVLYYYKNGNIRGKGFYLDSVLHYKWSYYFKNGNIYSSVEYDNGIINGEVCYYVRGKLFNIYEYKNGEKDGKYIQYNPKKGYLEATGYYKEGKRHGTFQFINDKGIIVKTGDYIEGKEQGAFKYYTRDGKLETVIIFNEGKILKYEYSK
ncbi:toxin-antitoxin system YwqK family antitoxin [Bacteroidota bacterium]